MDRRVVGWSAGRRVDHPYGWQISPWPARKVTEIFRLMRAHFLVKTFLLCKSLGHSTAGRWRFLGKDWRSATFRQEKRAQRLTLWVRRPPGGMGVFHAKGWWSKSSCPSLESLSCSGFEGRNLGCPGNFARMSRTDGGVQTACAKKGRAHFSFPILGLLSAEKYVSWGLVWETRHSMCLLGSGQVSEDRTRWAKKLSSRPLHCCWRYSDKVLESPRVASLRTWYRAQKRLNPGNTKKWHYHAPQKHYQRTPWGGRKRRGVENLTNGTPPQKGFWTPSRTVRFPPPSGVSALFFPVQKSTTEQTKSSFGGVQKFSGERVLWYVFLPPYVLHPPISRPTLPTR